MKRIFQALALLCVMQNGIEGINPGRAPGNDSAASLKGGAGLKQVFSSAEWRAVPCWRDPRCARFNWSDPFASGRLGDSAVIPRRFGTARQDCVCLWIKGAGLEMERRGPAWAPPCTAGWIWTECYRCWRTNRHQMTSDEMQKCCWQWQIPLFPLLFILRCQDKRQRYDVLEGMKEEL